MLEFYFILKIILKLHFKLPREFLTVQEALDFLWTLDDNDLDDIDNKLVILPPDPEALSDIEDIDDPSMRKIEETMRYAQCITNVHYIP
ncbi:hypothetical protein AVEN_165629-1 [Araneus ventricosus]|uniref:Uncharacterized protein n=1 Tax=Araneus ventricosus TaxID=182803 RepID=A0A4Y2IK54_ARAVE|nr:hypothetical protein AVEN_165629-1 [Araneus ventricosus]